MNATIKKYKSFQQTDRLVSEAVGSGLFPGCSLTVCLKNGETLHAQWGRLAFAPWSPEVSALKTWYDIASLTKPLATALALVRLVSAGKVDLHDSVGDIFHNVPQDKSAITIRQLLSHSSGLPPHRQYYRNWLDSTKKGRAPHCHNMVDVILGEPLEYEPGAVTIYSDLGFMLLACIVEKISETTFEYFVKDYVLEPLGASKIAWPSRINFDTPFSVAPTGFCPFERRMIQGEVNDLNARAGFKGHAGLFSTAQGLANMLSSLLDMACGKKKLPGFSRDLLWKFLQRDGTVRGSTWALGFDTPSEEGSSAGRYFSKESIGHLGFTGTSFWIDLKKEIIVVFLSNRTFPSATKESQEEIRKFRPRFHDEVMRFVNLEFC